MTTAPPSPSAALMAATSHHDQLLASLLERVDAFVGAVRSGSPLEIARAELLVFLRTEFLPHAQVEDALLYAAVRTDKTALLTRAMQDTHQMISTLVEEVDQAGTPLDAAIAAGALAVLSEVRITQENTHLLPALEAAGLDLAGLLGDRPELVG